ncbi:hypothetical protein GMLC_23510 [Geomonas limicola]|uniref:Uncharacterized protein n=1 Tax=Geomonas limicola TaxID=2740186 RepID=A0A6V8N861_9BACT|nr:hypothetical protein [Geomonas limicola]GFO68772.1 hypothetical protein GMLC_23510 [Geomonas limicola]
MVSDVVSASAAMPMFGAQPASVQQVSQAVPDTTAPAVQTSAPVGDTVNFSAQALQQSGTLGNIGGPAVEGSSLSSVAGSTTSVFQATDAASSAAFTSTIATSMAMTAMTSVDTYA